MNWFKIALMCLAVYGGAVAIAQARSARGESTLREWNAYVFAYERWRACTEPMRDFWYWKQNEDLCGDERQEMKLAAEAYDVAWEDAGARVCSD